MHLLRDLLGSEGDLVDLGWELGNLIERSSHGAETNAGSLHLAVVENDNPLVSLTCDVQASEVSVHGAHNKEDAEDYADGDGDFVN